MKSGTELSLDAAPRNPTVALLSHRGCPAVPSPKQGLTSVFGMGTGVAPALWTVGKPSVGSTATFVARVSDNRIVSELHSAQTCPEANQWSSLTGN